MVEGRVALLGGSADLEGAGSDVGGFHTAARGVPFVEECHQRVLGHGGFHLAERRQLLRVDADSLFREAGGRYATRNRGFALDAAHEAGAWVAGTGASGAQVSDPQLLEHLGARRNLQSPPAILTRLEGRQFLAAGKDHLRARRGFVRDGASRLAGILLIESDGFGDAISPRREDYPDGFGERTGQLADGESGSFD